MSIVFDPVLRNGRTLTEALRWNNYNDLYRQVIDSLKMVSRGRVNYTIVQTINVNEWPTKIDGFTYDEDSYLAAVRPDNPEPHREPDTADVKAILNRYDVCGKLNRGEIDELWLMGGPWFGFEEAQVAGPNAFRSNGPPIHETSCNRLLYIMGGNYQVGVGIDESLEVFGHRMEGAMTQVYRSWGNAYGVRNGSQRTFWDKFTLQDIQSPERGGCGNAHGAVNALPQHDGDFWIYDRSNTRVVQSSCNDFLNYPNLTGSAENISCQAWGCTTKGYLEWWFMHIPHFNGLGPDGVANDWWPYFIVSDNLRSITPASSLTPTPFPQGQTVSAATRSICSPHDGNVNSCDATPGCAFYFCDEANYTGTCWPRGTSESVACPATTARLEPSINGNIDNNQVFASGEQVNLATRLFHDSLIANAGCVPTDNPITFRIDGRVAGARISCQTLRITMPANPGEHTLSVEFPGEGRLGETRAQLRFRISPRPATLELSINGNTDSDQVLDSGGQVNLAAKLFHSSLNPNTGCVPTDNLIIFRVDGEEVGRKLACQPLEYIMLDVAGRHALTAAFHDEGILGGATELLDFEIAHAPPIPSATPPIGAPSGCTQPSQSGCPIQLNTSVNAVLNSVSDIHAWTFSTPATDQYEVSLSNLSVDYDIAVYESGSRNLVGSSNNKGTEDEIVSLPSGVKNYIVVVGAQRGQVSTDPYQLEVRRQTRRIIYMDFNWESIYPDASGQFNIPELRLPGVENTPQLFSIPLYIHYSDGTNRYLSFSFNYLNALESLNIPSPSPSSTPLPQIGECSLSVNPNTVIVNGESTVFELTNIPENSQRAQWNGTNPVSNNVPLPSDLTNFSGRPDDSLYRLSIGPYPPTAAGTYTRYVTIYDNTDNISCRTNTVTVNINPRGGFRGFGTPAPLPPGGTGTGNPTPPPLNPQNPTGCANVRGTFCSGDQRNRGTQSGLICCSTDTSSNALECSSYYSGGFCRVVGSRELSNQELCTRDTDCAGSQAYCQKPNAGATQGRCAFR